jgi:hypothetical protein
VSQVGPGSQDPDLQGTTTDASIYATTLYPRVQGFALYRPSAVPDLLELGDIGVIECGRFNRIFNIQDGFAKHGIRPLSWGRPVGPETCPPIYHNSAFKLLRSVNI